MKNLLNRLTRIMIIMLLLIGRTPFLNVYADGNFTLRVDLNGTINQGCGEGQYDYSFVLTDSYWDPSQSTSSVYLTTLVKNALLTLNPAVILDPTLTFTLSDAKYTSNGTDIKDVCVDGPTAVNLAPVANNDSFTIDEDVVGGLVVTTTNSVLVNDTDANSDSLTTELVVGPSSTTYSTFTFNSDGTFTFIPVLNFNGPVSFTYRAYDGTAYSNNATVNITVMPVMDTPIGQNSSFTIDEDGIENGTLAGLVSDADGGDLDFILVSGPAYNEVAFVFDTETGAYTYNHDGSENFATSFTYQVTDGVNTSAVYTISITILPLNDNTPIGQNSSFTIDEGAIENGTLAGLVSDTDGGDLDFVLVSGPAFNEVAFVFDVETGAYTYNHDGSENFATSFTYQVTDGVNTSAVYTITITITPINEGPIGQNSSFTINEDAIENGTLAGLVSDPEGTDLDFVLVSGPAYNEVAFVFDTETGAYTYNHDGSENFATSFTYQVTDGVNTSIVYTISITVTPVNDAPVAVDDAYTIAEDGELVVGDIEGVLNNDADVDGDSLTVTLVIGSEPENGSITLNLNGSFTYIPDDNFNGINSFVYEVSDGEGGTDTATVTITVTSVNDAPVAVDDTYTIGEDGDLVVSNIEGVLNNDTDVDGDSLTATLVDDVSAGTLLLNTDGSFTYIPNEDFDGSDSFTYLANDGTVDSNTVNVTITVTPVNDAPVAVDDTYTIAEDGELVVSDIEGVLNNDADVDGDSLTVTLVIGSEPENGSITLNLNGSFTYIPDDNFNGINSFVYEVSDGEGGTDTATVTITVTSVNDAPVANPLAFTVANAGTSTGSVTATDVDLPADTLTYSLLTPATNGTATVGPTGAYTYTHNGTGTLVDSFVFSVTDGTLSSTATVTVTVLAAPTPPPPPPANLAPSATPIAITVANAGTSTGTLSGSDPEGAPLSFTLVGAPANGTVVISPAGAYSYTHNGTTTVTDSFTFAVSDGSLSATATVSVTILPIPAPGNTPPVVVDGVDDGPFGAVIEGTLLPLGSDADGDPLTFSVLVGPTNGTLVLNPDGTFTYTPDTDFAGVDSFTFIANDGTDDSNEGTFTLDVLEEVVIITEPETPLAAVNNDWLWWLLALLAGLLLWLLAFLRPNMKYTLTDNENNQKVVRRRLAKPDENTMLVELSDKDMLNIQTIDVEFYKRLAKHLGNVTINFQLNGKVIHSVTLPEGIKDSFETLIRL